ncbi:WXG100 family type VII secretion target [Allorhizocola rhizosphaerae]|uniref:WXG100 family type VII secretion target n=1 Tax=Allorhizocola rhizosphaerae TaxID=1872709 RepID=UPI000E3C76C8|nr:hypothetical protein [Allorhizocola rhizosphaerae]
MGVRAGLAYPEGNPAALTQAAQRLSGLAARVAGAATSIGRSAAVSGWEGPRYEVFVSAGRDVAASLDPGAAALNRASSNLAQLGTRVEDAQRRIRAWAEEIEAAERSLQTAQSELIAARLAAGLTGRPTHLEGAFERASHELDELRARYIPKARQLCGELRQDDERAANALRAAAAMAPKAASRAPGPLSFLDLKTAASAGFDDRDGAIGAHASASIEAILARLHERFGDGTTTYGLDASVGASASASANAELGPNGLHLGGGADVQAGAKGSVSATVGDEDTFAITPSLDGRAGPGAGAHANVDVDEDGLHADIGAGLSPLIGGGVHLEVHVNPAGILDTIQDAPRTIETIKDLID